MNTYTKLKEKISKKKATVAVVGLGYVGLPIALELSKKGFKVNGLETNVRRVRQLKKGASYINDITPESIQKAMDKGKFSVTTNTEILKECDVVIICVPTPLRKVKTPNISYIIHACRSLSRRLHPGQLIIVESTTYPGTTRDVILPELEKSGLKVGKDFFLAFSPERIDPGNKKYSFTNIPKIIGGVTGKGTKLGELLYSKIIKKVVGVSTVEAAEVTKLLENTFRIVNIALINEFAMLCNKLKIDVWEVIDAAGTKPFGFMPFYPGPGIGGHCIPADPMYLSWKARAVGFRTKMVDLAAKTNRIMPLYVTERIEGILKSAKKNIKGARVLVIGVTYKKDVNDLRESPALGVIKQLGKKKVSISYHDPFIPYLDVHGIKMRSRKLNPALLKKQDLVLVITDHSGLDYRRIAKNSRLILDTRNVFGKKKIKVGNIVKL
jgi:UDP-N-acetyl-D-glucosamine dehydrogenase